MTNALVFIEACTICGRVQKTYLGRRVRRRTPLICTSCARPWIQWLCPECGATSHEQVDALPRRGDFSGTCAHCGTEADGLRWTRSTREQAERVRTTSAPAHVSEGRRG